ncbi:MAG: hypothetical protein QXV73_05370 [Candidatus Micrarchaeia archaeon]
MEMGSRIDKNDVDISRLFYYSDKFEIKGKNNKTLPVYVRLVGDAELNQARVFALRESAKLRQKLKNPDSDEYLAYIPDFSLMNKHTLIQTLLSAKMTDFMREATKNTKFNIPIEPNSDASLEEQEEYQLEVDNFDNEYNRKFNEELEKIIKREEDVYKSWSEEELRNECIRQTINQICEMYMIDRFRTMCVYFGTYKDQNFKEKLFKSFDEFDNLPKDIKEQFFMAYNKLEISETELKK